MQPVNPHLKKKSRDVGHSGLLTLPKLPTRVLSRGTRCGPPAEEEVGPVTTPVTAGPISFAKLPFLGPTAVC
jgi:hypothetical protein